MAWIHVRTLVCVVLLLSGCTSHEIRISDRHGLSFDPIAQFALTHPGTTLVLFDYHHDSGVGPGFQGPSVRPTSVDWVGTLVDRGLVDRVLWVSGRTLLLPNDNARHAWLRRKTATLSPARRQRILDCVQLTDSATLFSQHLEGPVVVSLDLDILTKDPGHPEERFLDEMADWMRRQDSPLITVALSSAYQPDPKKAWTWLEHFASRWPQDGRRWILDVGPHELLAESDEEKAAWKRWSQRPSVWRSGAENLRPGAGVWFAAPLGVRNALLQHSVAAEGEGAREVLRSWGDKDWQELENSTRGRALEEWGRIAVRSLGDLWQGRAVPAPEGDGQADGLAVRLHIDGHDRGCLALWLGASDTTRAVSYAAQAAALDPRYPPVVYSEASKLTVQPCLFGPWRPMNSVFDFVVGFHSVMVVDHGRHTLIQAPLALERGWDRTGFLNALAEKAHLGSGDWHRADLKWFRAATLWGELPATTPK